MSSEKENKIKWTGQQAHVIDTRCGNLLVAAAAGSGKTAVLVERIIEMVTGENSAGEKKYEPIDIDELLIVTFTNAAAAQMKDKIRRELSKRIDRDTEECGAPDEHLIRQLTLINHADICTIDSFCLRVVKEYFSKAGIDSAFDIGDSTEMELIKQDVMSRVMEACYNDPDKVEGFDTLVGIYSNKTRDKRVTDFVFSIAKVVSSYPEPYKWLDQAEAVLDERVGHDEADAEKERKIMSVPMVQEFTGDLYELIGAAKQMAQECLEEVKADGYLSAYIAPINGDIRMLDAMLDGDNSIFEIKRLYSKYAEKDKAAFGALGRADKNSDKAKRENIQKIRKKYKDMIGSKMAAIWTADEIYSQSAIMSTYLKPLLHLTRYYLDELMDAKKDRNVFEFHDIEEFAFKILCEKINEDGRAVPTEVGNEVSLRYREILIDEYQDSNFLQEYILASVSGHGEGISNTFMVGDVKQSIYKFRMARPDLFINKYDAYDRLSDGETISPDGSGSILLTRNFRSEINVLRCVNAIFEKLMSRRIGKIDYDESAKLNSRYALNMEDGKVTEPAPASGVSYGPKTEFVLMENTMGVIDEKGKYDNAAVEALYIASKIHELVNGAEPMYIGEGESRRRVSYSDIVILLRSVSTVGDYYEKAFEAAGIPLYIESESGYFDATEVKTLVSMLSIIDNSYIDYDLAAVLRSPLAGLTDEELAIIAGEYRIARESGEKKHGCLFYGKVRDYMKNHESEDTETMKKLNRFMEILWFLKKNKPYMSISDMIRYVLDETGYYWFAGARPMGRRRQANIDMLIKKADDFEATSKGVFNFIRYIGKLRTNDLDFAEVNVLGDDDVVRVMTMHKSKGLEFPVVFVAGLGRMFNKTDMNDSILIHPDYFLAAKTIDYGRKIIADSFYKDVIASRMKVETYAEELRVLYVALTRAKEKLYMTACVGEIEKFKSSCDMYRTGSRDEEAAGSKASGGAVGYAAIMAAGTYAEWIYAALSSIDEKDKDFIEEKLVDIRDFIASASNGNVILKLSEGEADTGIASEEESVSETCEDGEKFCRAVREHIEFEYGHKYSGLKSKLSITEIKKLQAAGEEDDTEDLTDVKDAVKPKNYVARYNDAPKPQFKQAERKPQKNEIGTMYHKIMELADFQDDSIEGAKHCVDRVFELKLFGEEYRDEADSGKICKMLQSNLGRRMARADRAGMLYREKQFYMMMRPDDILPETESEEDETIVVQGIIDAYFVEDGDIVLMDYKTDKVKGMEELAEKYRVQLEKYAEALERITEMKVKEKIIYSFCLDDTVTL